MIIHHTAPDAVASTGCRRYAVIGGGLAGVATAWHLLRLATPSSPVQLDLFDPAGDELPPCCTAATVQHGQLQRPQSVRGRWEQIGTASGYIELTASCGGSAAGGLGGCSDGERSLLLQGWAAAPLARQRGCCTPSARKAGR